MTGRTVHTLDAAGYVRDWLAGPAWSAPCDDLGEVLDGDGDPWGPDGRWVLTNGPDVAPLKERLRARRPLIVDQELPDVVEGGALSWVAPGEARTDTGTWRRVRTGRDGLVDGAPSAPSGSTGSSPAGSASSTPTPTSRSTRSHW